MIVKRNPDNPEACANCGSAIGRLENKLVWNQHVVCAECHSRLSQTDQSGGQVKPLSCPVCGSQRIQSVQMAYLQGSGSSRISGGTIGGNSVGIFDLNVPTQSLLAKQLSPPRKRDTTTSGICLVISSAGAMIGAAVGGTYLVQREIGDQNFHAIGASLLVVAVVCVFVAAVSFGYYNRYTKWNRDHWPNLYSEWRCKWICQQCGNVFTRHA